ncbi:hypothetical protein ABTF05_21745, partial [Acinetobacter baumannii]
GFLQQAGTLHEHGQEAGIESQGLIESGQGGGRLACTAQGDGLAHQAHDASQGGGVGSIHGRQLSMAAGPGTAVPVTRWYRSGCRW